MKINCPKGILFCVCTLIIYTLDLRNKVILDNFSSYMYNLLKNLNILILLKMLKNS